MKNNKTNKKIPKYKYKLIKDLKYKYWKLDLEIDSCQGCCKDLDGKFKELNFYAEQVKLLGDNVKDDSDKIISDIHKQFRQQQVLQEQEQRRKDKIITKLSLLDLVDLELYGNLDKQTLEIIKSMHNKINDICDILREQNN